MSTHDPSSPVAVPRLRPGARAFHLALLLCWLPVSVWAESNSVGEACFTTLATSAETAERACSDVIAGFTGLAAGTPGERLILLSALNNRAVARTRLGNLEGAAADLGEALTLEPDSWISYLNRGNLQLARNDPRAALADYERARQLAADSDPAAVRRAAAGNSVIAYRQLNDLARAQQSLALALAATQRSETPRVRPQATARTRAAPSNPPR